MDLRLIGKVAIVTGSSRGLGRAIAESLYNEGCYVVINSRKFEEANEVASALGDRARAVAGDVTDEEQSKEIVSAAVAFWGRLDILVCNVGSGSSVKPGDENLTEWQRVVGVNFFSTTNIVTASTSALSKNQGSIVCVSSICGMASLDAPLAYSTSKAALNSFVKCSSRTLAAHKIRINAVAPGKLIYPGSVWERKIKTSPLDVETMLSRDVSMGRLGTPEEVANLVSFLASSRASFCTGAIYVVDGGQLRS